MKPIAIFRHFASEGPGYFATYLDRRRLPWQLIEIDRGAAVPIDPISFSGIALMGGPMSVNDDLPWIPPLLDLLRKAVSSDVPLLGHCLGGQLIAKALGAKISANPVKEIGWGMVAVENSALAREWFGALTGFEAFHWHGETFDIPDGAGRLLGSPYCRNQAFAMGKHLALQCHVEMTPVLIASWCESGADEIAKHPASSVQNPATMQANIEPRLAALHEVADRLYDRWFEGLRYER
ncbi:MAG: type 1 glutamine amidotransferase [Betaproteobacteria bacterium]|nr:type 1 glutamine amidotransferase [Burkholderiales bacterium]MBA3775260.1 type 1 glutamine amidotransferase [Betaproteobacteria bacterium]MDQ3197468.1 type 1 glutamine amidotransferase [Pseudomonadota bacterium]